MGVEIAYGYWTNSLVRLKPVLYLVLCIMLTPEVGFDIGWLPYVI